jgi:hypothetical protein
VFCMDAQTRVQAAYVAATVSAGVLRWLFCSLVLWCIFYALLACSCPYQHPLVISPGSDPGPCLAEQAALAALRWQGGE